MSRHLGLWHPPTHTLTPYGPPLPTLRARAQKPREVNDSSKSSDQPWLLETLGNRLENIKWLWINRGAALTLSFIKKREEVSGQFWAVLHIGIGESHFFFFFLKILYLFEKWTTNNVCARWHHLSGIIAVLRPPIKRWGLPVPWACVPRNIWKKKKKRAD